MCVCVCVCVCGGGGVVKFWGYKLRRSEHFVPLQKSRFPTIIIFPAFSASGKNLPNRLEKKYRNTGRYFCSSFAILL